MTRHSAAALRGDEASISFDLSAGNMRADGCRRRRSGGSFRRLGRPIGTPARASQHWQKIAENVTSVTFMA
jgi:hypothetical protein